MSITPQLPYFDEEKLFIFDFAAICWRNSKKIYPMYLSSENFYVQTGCFVGNGKALFHDYILCCQSQQATHWLDY